MKAMKFIRFIIVELLLTVFVFCLIVGTLTVCPIMLLSLYGGLKLFNYWDERGQMPDFIDKYDN